MQYICVASSCQVGIEHEICENLAAYDTRHVHVEGPTYMVIVVFVINVPLGSELLHCRFADERYF
jgi:hypothetical protein